MSFEHWNSVIWNTRLSEKTFVTRSLLSLLRLVLLTGRSFFTHRCMLQAAALTFYTLLSIVPVAALAFAIAQGFGLEGFLRDWITDAMHDQPLAAEKIIHFSTRMLEGARGGVIAGVGAAVLFWATFCLLQQIERAFNRIWGVKKDRNLFRKISDYFSWILLFPILLILAGSASAFAASRLPELFRICPVLHNAPEVQESILMLGQTVPFLFLWLIFSVLYQFLPNTRVRFLSALVGGLLSASLYLLLQNSYFALQFLLGKYNAIYGGFAALPLFLFWLQVSWTIILLGAELSFASQNIRSCEGEAEAAAAGPVHHLVCALRILRCCAQHFEQHQPLPDEEYLSEKLEIPVRLVRAVLEELISAGLLIRAEGADGATVYAPAVPTDQMTLLAVQRAIFSRGELPGDRDDRMMLDLQRIWEEASSSRYNRPLTKIL